MEATSLVDASGDWREKKVSVKEVVSSFVSQLKVGQDLTRVSLPAVLLHPFSMLEVFASRELTNFEMLLDANSPSTTPLDRMISIVSWYCSCLPMDTWKKKPTNSVLGEVHQCHLQSSRFGDTHFVAEQVSHHPPISAIHIHNPKEHVWMQENLSFGVSFGGNSLSVTTSGAAQLTFEKLNETYIFDRKPDLFVKHLVIGSKKIYWEGEVTITCAHTQLTTRLKFYRDGDHSDMKGTTSTPSSKDPLLHFDGRCGEIFYMARGKEKKHPILDIPRLAKPRIYYPAVSQLEPLSSYNVWAKFNHLVVEGKTLEADEEKKNVEEQQRLRIKQDGDHYQGRLFQRAEGVSHIASAPITSSLSSSGGVAQVPSKWEIRSSALHTNL